MILFLVIWFLCGLGGVLLIHRFFSVRRTDEALDGLIMVILTFAGMFTLAAFFLMAWAAFVDNLFNGQRDKRKT